MGDSSTDQERDEKMTKIVTKLLDDHQTYDVSQELYSSWAKDGSYDEMLKNQKKHYAGPFAVMEQLKKFFPNPENVLVLDLGSGTGNVAERMMNLGFKNFHGLDPNKELVEISKKKGIYQRIMEQFIGGGSRVDVEDDTYDLIVTVGTFCPGHIPCDALHEIIRILKPGGYFINAMREDFMKNVPEYKDRLVPLMDKLVTEGKWKKVVWDQYPNHFNDFHGIIMVFQVC